jgi:hypothetical protein
MFLETVRKIQKSTKNTVNKKKSCLLELFQELYIRASSQVFCSYHFTERNKIMCIQRKPMRSVFQCDHQFGSAAYLWPIVNHKMDSRKVPPQL